MSRQITAPHVYQAITTITAAMAKDGIPKIHVNLKDRYAYRSIDDVLGRLGPLLAKHRLCVLPRILKREGTDGHGDNNSVMTSVHVIIAYDLVSSRDGSYHTIKASGEALDSSDKATAKALSAAYKSAMLQTFCVPVSGGEDAEAKSSRWGKVAIGREPDQGWQAWSEDMVAMISGCETAEALDRVRSRQAALLTAISRERNDLYALLGAAFADRAGKVAKASPSVLRTSGGTQIAGTSPLTAETHDA